MSKHHVKHLLVGGGLAAGSAAEAIRARDAGGAILLVGQEVNRPYHRPPLSKEYLRRQTPREQIVVEPQGWFAERDVELRTGRRVVQLDTARQTATIDTGEEVGYDALLLATGAAPKPLAVPGADLPNVYLLRTFEDVDRLQHAADQAKSAGRAHARGRGRAAVIGGGLLGV